MRSALVLYFLPSLLPLVQDGSRELERALKSKQALQRLEAVQRVAAEMPESAQKTLLKALNDDDWEVRCAAATELGKLADPAALESLLKAALAAPTRHLALAAARTIGARFPVEGADWLDKQLAAREPAAALFVLHHVRKSAALPSPAGPTLLRMIEDPTVDGRLKLRALRALACGLGAEDVEGYRALLAKANGPQAAVILEETRPGQLELVRCAWQVLAKVQPDYVERRLVRLVAQAMLVPAAAEQLSAALAFFEEQSPRGSAPGRWARLAEELLILAPTLGRELRTTLCEYDLKQSEPLARAYAARTLGIEAGAAEIDRLIELCDPSEARSVRLSALRSLAEGGATGAGVWCQAVQGCLAGDRDELVRELAAVALGRARSVESAPALAHALEDPAWNIAVVSAISLGMTRSPSALAALAQHSRHSDWRQRGAAVVALGELCDVGALPFLIARVEDEESLVARTAHEILQRVAGKEQVERSQDAWEKWHKEHAAKVQWQTPEALDERRRRYGYSTPLAEIYAGLDVVVLVSRGDAMEDVLEESGIQHRQAAAAQLTSAELHPEALFFANCTGELEADDVPRLAWFVRAGGALFSSCWALHETVEKVYPGVVRKLQTRDEVLDDVAALPVRAENPLLSAVFPPGVEPIYHLEGAHLIEVIEGPLVDILIDSPECAERHGGAELAVAFAAGHGFILDSVNHFASQGLETVVQASTAEERQAWALDHMGLSFAEWRETRKEKYWGNALKAAEAIHDRSMLHFVTNFVRERRIGDR